MANSSVTFWPFPEISQEVFGEFDLNTDVGWVHSFMAIEGFEEWRAITPTPPSV
jgi:hypothetical protein